MKPSVIQSANYQNNTLSDRSEEMKNILFSSRTSFVEGLTDKMIVD